MVDFSKFSKHWITGSDFSELALLESSLNELASSMEDVNLNINKKKMANFKQIDWTTIEDKLMKGPSTVRVRGDTGQVLSQLGSKETSRTHRLRNYSQESSLSREEVAELDQKVEWQDYLPRLRKSLRGLHPLECQGNYWPQRRNRSITYNAHPQNESQQQRNCAKSPNKQSTSPNPRLNTRDNNARGSPLRNDLIRDQMIVNGIIYENPRDESQQDTRSKFEMYAQSRTKYEDKTYFNQSQSTMRNTNRVMAPRLGRDSPNVPGTSLNSNFDRSILSKALLEKIAMTPKPEWFQEHTVPSGCPISPKPQVGITLETVKAQRDGSHMRGETAMMQSGTIDNSQENTTLLASDHQQNYDATGLTYASAQSVKQEMNFTYTSLNANNIPGHDQQPKQLQIQKISPQDHGKKQGKNNSPFQVVPNYSNLVSPQKEILPHPDHRSGQKHLQIFMNDQLPAEPVYRKGRYYMKSMKPVEKKLSKHTIGQVSNAMISQNNANITIEQQAAPFKSPSSRMLTSPFNPLGQANSKGMFRELSHKNSSSSPQEFTKMVKHLYSKKSGGELENKHTNSYLEKVHQIREETSKTALQKFVNIISSPTNESHKQLSSNVSVKGRDSTRKTKFNSQIEILEAQESKVGIETERTNSAGSLDSPTGRKKKLNISKLKNENIKNMNISSENELQVFAQGIILSKTTGSKKRKQQLREQKKTEFRFKKQEKSRKEIRDMKITQELSGLRQDQQKDGQDQPNADITSDMVIRNQFKVGIQKRTSGNKIKGAKVTAKNQIGKARSSLPAKQKGASNRHALNSLEDASQLVSNHSLEASSQERSPAGHAAYPDRNDTQTNTPDQGLQGTLEVKKMADAKMGVFTTSSPTQLDVNVNTSAQQQETVTEYGGLQSDINSQRTHSKQGTTFQQSFRKVTGGDFDRAIRVSPHNFGDSSAMRTRNNSQVVTLEGIYVRKPEHNFQLMPIESLNQNGASYFSPRASGRRFASVQPKEKHVNAYKKPDDGLSTPISTKMLNLSAIPNAIKVEGILQSANDAALAPPNKRRTLQNRRNTVVTPLKAKKVEDVNVIVNRVVRANCCLQPQNPEELRIMQKAVGSHVDYFSNPTKAMRIRLKFLHNNFLQGVTEDFMSTQNLERNVDQVIIQSPEIFRYYEIEDEEEQQLVVRLFKRFYFRTIEKKYGYLKQANDPPEISGSVLCSELEINPRVLRLSGVVTTLADDTTISWTVFLRILSMFLLRKDVLQMRLEMIVKFLAIKNDQSVLERAGYIQDQLQKLRFLKRSNVIPTQEVQNLWNRTRTILFLKRNDVFQASNEGMIDEDQAVKVLKNYGITVEETWHFFDCLFEIP